MPILNYTTTIAADKTASEIQRVLARVKAASTSTTYDEQGNPDGLAFTLRTPHGRRDYRMPVNVEGVHEAMKRDRSLTARQKEIAQARRTAWRIAKVWIEAQVALIDAEMVTPDEVMLPYLLVAPDTTVYDRYRENEQRAIEVGRG